MSPKPANHGDNASAGDPSGVTPELERRRNRTPFVLLGLVLLVVFAVTGYTMFARAVVYYRTPTEVLRLQGERVRLSGTVAPGTIEQSLTEGIVTFSVTDGTSSVTVVFDGPAPDTLKDDAEAVAEGELGRDGVFHAVTLFAKCPSKFESKPEA